MGLCRPGARGEAKRTMREMHETDRLTATVELIDEANAVDPVRVRFEDVEYPAALVEGRRAYSWAGILRQQSGQEAPEPLLVAARGHHLRRWEIPRERYPRTREGYLAWRTSLYAFHATAVGEIMSRTGYTAEEVDHAARLLGKERIKVDADAQTYEDAVSLAFLEVRLGSFAETVTEEQLTRALRRTWRKMSEAGRDAALTLTLAPAAAAAVRRALAE